MTRHASKISSVLGASAGSGGRGGCGDKGDGAGDATSRECLSGVCGGAGEVDGVVEL